MAYSDYGAFVHLNDKRRRDKEDVGVYDTDESVFPSGVRVYANIIKNGSGKVPWYRHSQHGVMGDGDTRVASPDEYDHEFILYGWRFRFWGDINGGTPKYMAVMERDEEYWECTYDYCYGAGF